MAEEKAREVVDEAEEKLGGSNGKSRFSGLKSKDILLPAAATAAAAAAAGLAAKKGPDVMKMLGSEAGEEAEELGRKGAEGAKKELGAGGGVAGKAASIESFGDSACAHSPSGGALSTAIRLGKLTGRVTTLTGAAAPGTRSAG